MEMSVYNYWLLSPKQQSSIKKFVEPICVHGLNDEEVSEFLLSARESKLKERAARVRGMLSEMSSDLDSAMRDLGTD